MELRPGKSLRSGGRRWNRNLASGIPRIIIAIEDGKDESGVEVKRERLAIVSQKSRMNGALAESCVFSAMQFLGFYGSNQPPEIDRFRVTDGVASFHRTYGLLAAASIYDFSAACGHHFY